MWKHIVIAFKLSVVSIVLLGLVYPLLVTGLAQLFFPYQANGSLIRQGDKIIGSSLIGQKFTRAEYFHSRPSAANYDAGNSTASNLGPTSKALVERVIYDVELLEKENGGLDRKTIPADAVTSSASGLDGDISPAYAFLQVKRVAQKRKISENELTLLVKKHIQQRQIGVFGDPRVNVLRLNLEIDQKFGKVQK